MRSKPRARKLAQDTPDGAPPTSEVHDVGHVDDDDDDGGGGGGVDSESDELTIDYPGYHDERYAHPEYASDDIGIPDSLELGQSESGPGVGVWTKCDVPIGTRYGPLPEISCHPDDPTDGNNQMLDDFGKVKNWITTGSPQARHWMSYVQRAHSSSQPHNLVSLHVNNQVCYEAVQDIPAGDELLLPPPGAYPERYATDVPEQEYGRLQYPCIRCGEVLQSAPALHRHQAYVCRGLPNSVVSRTDDSGDFNARTTITASVNTPINSHSITERNNQQGILPVKSEVQEMIQDTQRTELPSPSQRPVHDISNPQHAVDIYNSKLNSTLSSLKQFPCENCDKVFADSLQLQRHIRSLHVGARAHTCSECGKTFATSSGLKQHQHIHSSVKPFQCEVCLKAYTQFSNLCRHKRMHADCRQQIKCKDCGQTFSTMTSLGKHKRFCQGMISNGAGRLGFHSPAAANLAAEKSPGLNNPSKMSSFPNPYASFYGARSPFPFFPPVGASFPVFPSGHPVAAMMSASLAEKKFGHPDKEPADYRQEDSDSEERKQPRWPSDHSNLSTTSDLAKSDIESGSESEHNFRNGLCESPHSMKTSSPAVTNSPLSGSGRSQPAYDLSKKRKRPGSAERPFDLSKTLSPAGERHSDTKSESGYGGEQPLDLSYKSGKEDTPRKTHIFGKDHGQEKADDRPAKISSAPTGAKAHSPVPVPAIFPKGKLSIDCQDKLHDAYPANSASQAMMSRMYGGGLEKSNVDIYHEAARLMTMAPSRFVFPGMPSPFTPFSGTLPAMFPTGGPLDQAKGIGANFMRGHAAPFPYTPGMKLKDRYTCKFCGKIFPRSANLTRHLRTHTGEQPYKCKYCERSFSISSNLQRHIRNIHNKEKPFKCPICDRCFGQQTNLDRHLKKHEYEGPVVADSPFNEEPDCDEVGALNGGDLGSTGSSGHGSELSSPVKDDKDVVSSSFSITGRMVKVEPKDEPSAARRGGGGGDELRWEHANGGVDHRDDDVVDANGDEADGDDAERSPAKKAKLLNNNLPDNSYSNHVVGVSNGSS